MTPKEKSKELIKNYTKERSLIISNQMMYYYLEKGNDILAIFWDQVYNELDLLISSEKQ